jgi:hypothetical protein
VEHNFHNLKAHILPLSVSEAWDEAKYEWELDHVQVLEVGEEAEPETCPCGHFPIIELCWIRNRKNGNVTFVGNVCVKRFMGMPADTVAAGFRRVMADPERALNAAAVEFAHAQGWLSDWERGFCLATSRKRRLSGKQMAKRVQINQHLLSLLRQRRAERQPRPG